MKTLKYERDRIYLTTACPYHVGPDPYKIGSEDCKDCSCFRWKDWEAQLVGCGYEEDREAVREDEEFVTEHQFVKTMEHSRSYCRAYLDNGDELAGESWKEVRDQLEMYKELKKKDLRRKLEYIVQLDDSIHSLENRVADLRNERENARYERDILLKEYNAAERRRLQGNDCAPSEDTVRKKEKEREERLVAEYKEMVNDHPAVAAIGVYYIMLGSDKEGYAWFDNKGNKVTSVYKEQSWKDIYNFLESLVEREIPDKYEQPFIKVTTSGYIWKEIGDTPYKFKHQVQNYPYVLKNGDTGRERYKGKE